jgi:hypothetical protein
LQLLQHQFPNDVTGYLGRFHMLDTLDHPIGHCLDLVQGGGTTSARFANALYQFVTIKGLLPVILLDDGGMEQRSAFVRCESLFALLAFTPATDVAVASAGVYYV